MRRSRVVASAGGGLVLVSPRVRTGVDARSGDPPAAGATGDGSHHRRDRGLPDPITVLTTATAAW